MTAFPIRVALIGLGAMGRRHLEILSSLAPQVEIVAVADTHPPFADRAASIAPSAKAFHHPLACLDESDVDAAIVATARPRRSRSAHRHRGTLTVGSPDALAESWIERFNAAYRAQDTAWIGGVAAETTTGASAYDGYAANAVVAAALSALRSGNSQAVDQPPHTC